MKRLLTCIQKDIRLLIGSGTRTIVTLLLPILLVFAMYFGMSDIANQRNQVSTFSIAVIDLDNTPMSNILIGQLRNIELFQEVYLIEDKTHSSNPEITTTDLETLFNEYNVAAVLTIPKDFFFSLYDMRNFTVEIKLNRNMPLEAAIFQSLTTSIMDIIKENQQMMWAVHTLKYGELDGQRRQELYLQASFNILEDALGRQGIFAPEQILTDDATSTALFLYGSILSMFILFIPLCILRTLPEELALGILPRYQVKGGSLFSFIFSKTLAAFLICFAAWILLTIFLFPFSILKSFLLFVLCFIGAFSFFLLISTIIKSSSHSQIIGNLVLLLFMLLGGGLYPLQMLPEALQAFSPFTIPYYFIMGLTGISLEFSLFTLLTLLLPLLITSLVFLSLSFLLLKTEHRGQFLTTLKTPVSPSMNTGREDIKK